MLKSSLSVLAMCAASAAAANCDTVTFSDVGWTDITATTAATTVVLDALGYDTDIKVLSVPATYTALADGDVDIFLGNWMPTMEADIAPYREAGAVRASPLASFQPFYDCAGTRNTLHTYSCCSLYKSA